MNISQMILGGAVLSFGLATSALSQETPPASTVLATVNGVEITLGHMTVLRARLPEQYEDMADEVLYPAILDQLIQQAVLAATLEGQVTKRIKLAQENESRAFLASEKLKQISDFEPSEEQVLQAYDDQYGSRIPEPEYNASHILVATEEEALELVKLLDDGADFVELAQEKSTGPSGPNGGALGWFGKGAMVQPFEEAVQKMAVGEISPPVKTQFGWHVLILNDLRSIPVPSLIAVRPQLVVDLQQAGVTAEIERLTAAANVVRLEVDIDPSAISDVSILEE